MLDVVYGACAVCLTSVVVYAILRALKRADELADRAKKIADRADGIASRAEGAMEDGKDIPKHVARMTGAVAGVVEHAAQRIHCWLEGEANQAEQRLRNLENGIRQIQATQALGFCTHLCQGLSTLRRWDAGGCEDTPLLEDVRKSLRHGLSDLELYVRATEPQLLLQHFHVSLLMLELLRQAAEIEVDVLTALGRRGEGRVALEGHTRLRELWTDKLESMGDLRRQILPPEVRRGCDGKPGAALEQLVAAASRVCVAEADDYAVASVPRAAMR